MKDKDKEALKMALDVLEAKDTWGSSIREAKDRAITAIKEALAQQSNEQVEHTDLFSCDIKARPLEHPLRDYHHAMSEGPLHYEWTDKPHRLVYDLIAAVKFYAHPPVPTAQPKEPEQEPVAWITNNGDGWLRWHRAKDNNSNSIPLYTTPPQRTWVGLTDDEMTECIVSICNTDDGTGDTRDLIRAVEAKLKEKNT